MKVEQPGGIQVDAQQLVNQIALQRNDALDAIALLQCKIVKLESELRTIKGNGHGVVMHKEIDDAGHPTV